MKMVRRNGLFGGASALALLTGAWASPALAQAEAAQADASSHGVETIVVTATKRKENLQDVPVAVSAFSEKMIEARGIQEARDLNAPNFVFPQMYTTSRSYISVRGIFQEVNNIGFDGGFSVYLDGVYMGRNMSYDVDMFGVERIEILRGPQGTLFGKNTIGGLMNIVSKEPGPDFEGNIQGEIGNMDLARVRGSLNIPIVEDVLSTRISVQKVKRDGYVENTAVPEAPKGGSIDVLSSRAQILFTPNDNLKITASFDYLDSEGVGNTSEIIASKSTVPALGDDIPFTYSPNRVPQELKKDKGASLTAEYEFGDGHTLTSITGIRQTKTRFILDGDGASIDLYYENLNDQQDLWSQELRLASPTGDRLLSYVLGLYYYDERAKAYDPIPFSAEYPGGPFNIVYNDRVRTKDYAAFAHVDLRLSNAFNLYGGLRYTDETKTLRGERLFLPAGNVISDEFIPPLSTDATGAPPQLSARVHSKEFTWEIGAQYHVTDDIMAYAEVSTGFKSGGFNLTNGATVDPEHLTSYEIGAKTSFLDRRLTLNVAAFYNDYKDLQVRSLDLNAVPPAVVLQNAASVVAKGFEVELQAVPTDNLILNLGLGYVHSTYKDFQNVLSRTGQIIDASGNRLPMTPPWTINGGVQYSYPLANDGKVVLHADFNFTDDRWSILDAGQNTPSYALNSYATVNGRIGYQAPDDRWQIFLWVKNLFDEVTLVDQRPTPLLGPSATYPNGLTLHYGTYLEPRTYGVSMAVNF